MKRMILYFLINPTHILSILTVADSLLFIKIFIALQARQLIAVDLDVSDKAQIQFFCGKCLVEQLNNNKVTTIEQSKERIQQIKSYQKDIKIKENQARLNYYKNILDQIMDFKQSIDTSLEKMYKQIQQYLFPIQKEKQELQEFESQLNYFEDLKQLSELYSQEQQQSPKLIEDNNFINEIQREFELLFNSSEYFQTIDTFKNTKETIKNILENNVIELVHSNIKKNNFKGNNYDYMDSQKQKIEDRFACVDCIYENPQIKYQNIENIDKQWKEYNMETENIFKVYKKESKEKKCELFNQLGQMRRNNNKQLNEISEKLIAEQFLSIDKTKQSNQIKNISIKTLDDGQLLKDLRQLIEKEKASQSQTITNLKNKDQIFKKDIQYHLECLQQYDQQDIQQSLEILKEVSIEKDLIIQLTDMIQDISNWAQKDENYKNQINLIKEIQEFIDQAKKYQCQLNKFDQTIMVYQHHVQKIESIRQHLSIKSQNQDVKSEQLRSQYSKLSNILNEYVSTFHNNSIQLKKYCTIRQLENDIVKLKETNTNLEIEKDNLINSMQKSFEQKLNETNNQLEQKEIEKQKIKQQYEKAVEDNVNMKMQYEENKKKFEDEYNKVKQEFNLNLTQKNSELQQALMKLDQINKVKIEQENQLKMEIQKIQQYNKSLSFSNAYKHVSCQVTEGAKVVAEVSNSGWYYCLCDQAIPKNVDHALWLELDLERLCRKIIIRNDIKLGMEHIQSPMLVILIHITTRIYIVNNYHLQLQLVIQLCIQILLLNTLCSAVEIILLIVIHFFLRENPVYQDIILKFNNQDTFFEYWDLTHKQFVGHM
ncbi:unnamed protein product [Paramecium octaurelia]|uniref:Uncharacterized protein n=1 Tax=Paramecium octaurelia TaxID=43137 RepID=A0A8S1XC98_PAROT|nr:unnamed protein product [Paramecium octaurelia]